MKGHTHDESRGNLTAAESAHVQSVNHTEHSKLLPWLMLVCLLSGISLAMSIMTLITYQNSYRTLERENRLAQAQVDGMRVALLARGIDPAPHLKGDAP